MTEIKAALTEQYRAGLAMLAQCVQNCPEDLWTSSNPCKDGERSIDRSFWRIAFHAVYFTNLYLGQDEDSFQPWPGRRPGWHDGMWSKPWDLEPFELPADAEPQTKEEMLDYIAYVSGIIEPTVGELDLASSLSGFHWYKNITKLSHQLLNVRHLQGHVGQLSELLMLRGIDIDWVSKR